MIDCLWIHVHTSTIYSVVDKVVMLEIVATITILLRELISNLSPNVIWSFISSGSIKICGSGDDLYMTNLGTQYIHLAEFHLCGFIVDSLSYVEFSQKPSYLEGKLLCSLNRRLDGMNLSTSMR